MKMCIPTITQTFPLGRPMDTMDFDGAPIRVLINDIDTWFCLKDVCATLGIKDQSEITAKVREFEKNVLLYSDNRLKALGNIDEEVVATKRERQLLMIGRFSLRYILKSSRKPLARDMRAWLAGQKRKTERPNQREVFADNVNLYHFADRTYGLRMAAKILNSDLEIFAKWIEDGYLHPDRRTPQDKYAHLFMVKSLADDNGRLHFQVFLTPEGFTLFRQPRNRPPLPSKTIPLD